MRRGFETTDKTMPRFTILVHAIDSKPEWRGPQSRHLIAAGPTHWDWLFQQPPPGTSLWAWATDPLDVIGSGCRVTLPCGSAAALRLVDHRDRYLDYEGPIEGRRGSVRQIATGHYDLLRQSPDRFEMQLYWTGSQSIDDGCVIARFTQSKAESTRDSSIWSISIDDVSASTSS